MLELASDSDITLGAPLNGGTELLCDRTDRVAGVWYPAAELLPVVLGGGRMPRFIPSPATPCSMVGLALRDPLDSSPPLLCPLLDHVCGTVQQWDSSCEAASSPGDDLFDGPEPFHGGILAPLRRGLK